MSKLRSTYPTAARPAGPLSATSSPLAPATHEGGSGFAKDVKTELFTLALTNFVGENTFYESAGSRDTRFVDLVRAAGKADPVWTAAFIVWLRNEGNMRTASVVAALEFAASGAENARQVVANSLARADEPAEAVAYWFGAHGRKMPYAIKRGIADAVVRLYSERSAVKWDSAGSSYRMGDVIEIVHPKPRDAKQSALFQYLIDSRHNRTGPRGIEKLPDLETLLMWRSDPGRRLDDMPRLATWEMASSLMPVDQRFWETLIMSDQLGYMALLRNLRNFEAKLISDEARDRVAAKLTDPAEVAASRQLPFRFWSAWKNSGTVRFGPALEKSLDIVAGNVPEFRGRTLIMVDTSGSMSAPMSAKSKIARMEAGALFGAIMAARSTKGVLAMYASTVAKVKIGPSILRTTEDIVRASGRVGHGTETWPSTRTMWNDHGPFDRVLVFTDMQDHPGRTSTAFIPKHVPVYVWDLAGYKTANIETGSNRHLLGGLSDKTFTLLQVLEAGSAGRWPWE